MNNRRQYNNIINLQYKISKFNWILLRCRIVTYQKATVWVKESNVIFHIVKPLSDAFECQ